MTLRIGWLSPLTPASGVGTFSHALAESLPDSIDGEAIDVTLLYPDHAVIHQGRMRSVRIEDTDSFRNVLELFDVLVYNVGNNTEHHDTIFRLLRTHPGVVICHDYVYQHYLADRSMHSGGSFASFAGLLMKFGDEAARGYLARSRITSRLGRIRYSPWDSEAVAEQPMSEAILDLGSALVAHSRFTEARAETHFQGPILRLGMPHDQKPARSADNWDDWARIAADKRTLLVVSFGHVQVTKCIDLVIEAIDASKRLRRSLRYTVVGHVGDWDYLRRIEGMVAAAGLGEIVHIETSVSDARLSAIMREADAFINLRRPNTEGSSASLIEQLDTGRPVLVLDSGCYAELPSAAAVKLPADAGRDEIRDALEQLVANPARLPAIGAAGRAHARMWSCASYGEHLVRFIQEHRDLLRRRGRTIGTGRGPCGESAADDESWIANLARARAALRYLDRNVMTLDPGLVTAMAPDELCSYVAHVILGIFDDARLQRALSRYLAKREGQATYWACAKFFLVAEAVLGTDGEARQRLCNVGPCYDPEFWAVIEALPPVHFATAAAAMLLGRLPTPEEVALAGEPCRNDRLAKRGALLEILKRGDDRDAAAAKLKLWLEQPLEPELESMLPAIERALDCSVGSALFREYADLSGFYPQEADCAWTRGARGFIGLRLGPDVRQVEIVTRAVNAAPDRPAVIGLSSGTSVTELEVNDSVPHHLTLDIPRQLTRSDSTTWLQLSTTDPGPPLNSNDTRNLGMCLFKVRTHLAPCEHGTDMAVRPAS